MQCVYCNGSMEQRSLVAPVEGVDTGGFWYRHQFECSSCTGSIVHDVVEKIGHLREHWMFDSVPASPTRRSAQLCRVCDEAMISARPQDAAPRSAISLVIDMPAHTARRCDHLCCGCGARVVLNETMTTTWTDAATGAGVQFPRRADQR